MTIKEMAVRQRNLEKAFLTAQTNGIKQTQAVDQAKADIVTNSNSISSLDDYATEMLYDICLLKLGMDKSDFSDTEEETVAEETPVEEVPAEETPADDTPVDETPADETPAESEVTEEPTE